MKKGDFLYCHTTLVMMENKNIALTKGKEYEIISDDEYGFEIINDYHEEHTFTFGKHGFSYYGQWLDRTRILRRKKLNKIYLIS